jgi:aldehyde:ferredoxin oxidoreductase
MGSKNLKAIAVRGTGEITLNDPRGLLESSYRIVDTVLKEEPLIKLWQEQGATTSLMTAYHMPLDGRCCENRKAADVPI